MCGSPFVAPVFRGDRFCSALCAKKAERRRSRAVKAGVDWEHYTLADIAARDGFRCGLCRRKVNMALTVPHRRAPTVDHIVPRANGGHDVRVNVQLAHFICNSRKQANSQFEQILLVG